MNTPEMLNDIVRLLLQLTPAMALVALLLGGIALRLDGGSTFAVGGGFTRWMFWAIVMIALPQLLLWFTFFGLSLPVAHGGIVNEWLAGIRDAVNSFINDFVIARLVVVIAAYFVIRAILDAAHGIQPLPSILTAMFILAIPATAAFINSLQTDTRFSAVDILDALWNYLASRIMPIAAGLAVIGAIFNFVTHRPAMRLVACSLAFLSVSALWKLVLAMM
jgi:hypothetical protein